MITAATGALTTRPRNLTQTPFWRVNLRSPLHMLLQNIKDKSGKPYTSLQYGRRVVCEDGMYKWQTIPERPQRKSTTKITDIPSIESFDHLSNPKMVSILSLLSKGEGTFKGEVNGQAATILIDTGATDYNYISHRFVTLHSLPILAVSNCISVKSVHAASDLYDYCVVNVVVSYGNYASVTIDIPFLVLASDGPCDIILGMPAITQYNLLEIFKTYFSDKTDELLTKQANSFPHFQATRFSSSGSRKMSGVF